jgi:hypothetical protein
MAAACQPGESDPTVKQPAPPAPVDTVAPRLPMDTAPGGALMASKISAIAGTMALASSGRGVFDSFLACPRRGVIKYHESAGGRWVTINRCDTGAGIVVDGTAQLRYVIPDFDVSRLTQVELIGDVTHADGWERRCASPP